MANSSGKNPRRVEPTDALAEKVAKRVLELLKETARRDSERRGQTTRRNP